MAHVNWSSAQGPDWETSGTEDPTQVVTGTGEHLQA